MVQHSLPEVTSSVDSNLQSNRDLDADASLCTECTKEGVDSLDVHKG